MFFFSKSNSLSIGSNTGKLQNCTSVTASGNNWAGSPNSGGGCLVQYNTDGTTTPAILGSVASTPLQCPGGPTNPTQVPTVMAGNILLGPCGGTAHLSPGQTTNYGGDSAGHNRGFLFFQTRSLAADGGACTGGFAGRCAILGGQGSFIFSGFTYFHKGSGACGTAASCLTFAGGSGGTSFTLGDIVTDKTGLVGGASITMILNPNTSFPRLFPSLLQ
jgi:hypothetical protein